MVNILLWFIYIYMASKNKKSDPASPILYHQANWGFLCCFTGFFSGNLDVIKELFMVMENPCVFAHFFPW